MKPGFYVVVGVFRVEINAKDFLSQLNRKKVGAYVEQNGENSLYYVYTNKFEIKEEALKSLNSVRSNPDFSDAWIKTVLSQALLSNADPELPAVDTLSDAESDPIDNYYNEEIVQNEHIDLGNTEVFLSLFNAANNRVVDGKVQVIDAERGKLIKTVAGNDYLILPNPQSESGLLTLMTEVFGYRKVQHELHYNEPLTDTNEGFVELMGTSFVVNFDLTPFQKGDIQTLYNVYFFNDAAVMMPESRFELNNLLHLMQDSPTARIRLHGHTNGSFHGKIIEPAENEYFTLTGSKQEIGSANDLAYKRAEVIKNWLKSEGIDPSRIEIKSWGGKRPLYDKNSVNARKNVRVEVEKLED